MSSLCDCIISEDILLGTFGLQKNQRFIKNEMINQDYKTTSGAEADAYCV